MNRIIRKALSSWLSWRSKRKLYRSYPELYHFDIAEQEARKRHAKVNDIRAARKECMTNLLRSK